MLNLLNSQNKLNFCETLIDRNSNDTKLQILIHLNEKYIIRKKGEFEIRKINCSKCGNDILMRDHHDKELNYCFYCSKFNFIKSN